jgi:Tol biopolymer transport system component
MRIRTWVATAVVALTAVAAVPATAQGAPAEEPTAEQLGNVLDRAASGLRGRIPTPEERERWLDEIATGERDLEAIGRELGLAPVRAAGLVFALYRDTLGRNPDAAGRDYWRDRLTADEPIFRVEAGFYASPEYYDRSGGTDASYVEQLYVGILGRAHDVAGRDFWVAQLARGVRRSTVALRFLNTPEVRGAKADVVFRALFRRPALAEERRTWGPLLVTLGDAGRLVASPAFLAHVNPDEPPVLGPRCGTVVPGTEGLTEGDLSGDGTQVVFSTTPTGAFPEVYLRDLTGGTTTLLSTGPGAAREPSISRDGDFVAWRRTTPGTGDGGDIEVWDRATGTVVTATSGPAGDGQPVISDDGRYLAHTTATTGSDVDVVVLDRTTGTAVTLPEVEEDETDPRITPDGRFVAYTSSVDTGPGPSYPISSALRWDRTTGTVVEAPQGPAMASAAGSLSDDGAVVGVLRAEPNGSGGIDVATWRVASGIVRAVPGAAGTGLSGDGTTLAFASEESNLAPGGLAVYPDLYVRDEATGVIERLADEMRGLRVAATSTDGSVVLYSAKDVAGPDVAALLVCDRTDP